VLSGDFGFYLDSLSFLIFFWVLSGGIQWPSQPKIWGEPKCLILGEEQYFWGIPPLKAQNDSRYAKNLEGHGPLVPTLATPMVGPLQLCFPLGQSSGIATEYNYSDLTVKIYYVVYEINTDLFVWHLCLGIFTWFSYHLYVLRCWSKFHFSKLWGFGANYDFSKTTNPTAT